MPLDPPHVTASVPGTVPASISAGPTGFHLVDPMISIKHIVVYAKRRTAHRATRRRASRAGRDVIERHAKRDLDLDGRF